MPFDEIRFVQADIVTASLGATQVYGAVLTRFCAGDTLSCTSPNADPGYYTKLNLPPNPNPDTNDVGYPMTVAVNANDPFLSISVVLIRY
jgi:hypothetical protein